MCDDVLGDIKVPSSYANATAHTWFRLQRFTSLAIATPSSQPGRSPAGTPPLWSRIVSYFIALLKYPLIMTIRPHYFMVYSMLLEQGKSC